LYVLGRLNKAQQGRLEGFTLLQGSQEEKRNIVTGALANREESRSIPSPNHQCKTTPVTRGFYKKVSSRVTDVREREVQIGNAGEVAYLL